MRTFSVVLSFLLLASMTAIASEPVFSDIILPAPLMEGGKPLMETLKIRQSSRIFSDKELSPQVLSNLLWAAFGINRPDSGKRTAPSARNWQEVDVYAVTAKGVYLYDAKENRLKAHLSGDIRKLTGGQPFVADAPLNLVFVVDSTRMTGVSPDDMMMYAGADVAFISQNVYLFCASEGLGTVVRGMVDRPALAEAMNLPEHCKIIFAQTVGY